MQPNINIKELCKRISAGRTRGSVIWCREANRHFITDRRFLVVFDELPREVMIALFGLFCKVAEVGQTLNMFAGDEVLVKKEIDFDQVYQPERADVTGETTPFLKQFDNKLSARVIKFPNRYVLLNEAYVKLANNPKEARTFGNIPTNPVYLADGQLLVLPYRITKDQDNTTVNAILEGAV